MPSLHLRVLGGFQVRSASGPPIPVTLRKAQALLGYLACRPGQDHPRDKLAALLWPDVSDRQARHGLRQALFSLRHALPSGPPCLLIGEDSVTLDPAAIEVDVAEFERLVGDGTPAALEEAGRLYGGDLLEGLGTESPPFEEWLLAERERLRERALEALARLLAHQRRAGLVPEAVATALRLVAFDPLQEAVHRTLMRLYAQQGRRDAALRQYQLCVEVLQRDLGVEPEVETRELYQGILRERAIAPATAGADATVGRRLGVGAEFPDEVTPLIARETEMEQLRAQLDAALDGRGQTLVVLGEAGIGKSRLLREVGAEAVRRGALVLVGHSYQAERGLPFGLWIDVLGASGVMDDEQVRHLIGPTWQTELGRLFPQLVEGQRARPAGPGDDVRLFQAVAHLVGRLAEAQPLVLVLEDLHWADEMSVRLLSLVARRLPAWPVLIVATAREEEVDDSGGLRNFLRPATRLALAPLSEMETVALVRALAGTGPHARAVSARAPDIWERSGGNPFVAVETVRLLEQDASARTARQLPLPERVHEAVAARLETLGQPGRRLAAVAAVIGRQFAFELLQRASGLPEVEAAEGVEELVRRRVLRLTGERFDLVHDRIREAIAAGLLAPHRRVLHRQVGEALEEIFAGDSVAECDALGRHFREAEVWDKAVGYLRQAGVQAMARSAHREAMARFEAALEALGRLPQTRELRQLSIDLRLQLRLAFVPFGPSDRPAQLLEEAERIASDLGDQRRLGHVLIYQAYGHWERSQFRDALEVSRRALATVLPTDDAGLVAEARMRLGQTLIALGEYRAAADELRQIRDADPPDGVSPPVASSTLAVLWLIRCLAETGDLSGATREVERAFGIAEGRHHPYTLAFAFTYLGLVDLFKGDAAAATRALEHSRSLCAEGHYSALAPMAASLLGSARLLAGSLEEALPLLREGVEAASRFRASWLINLGAGLLEATELDEAERCARSALEEARQLGDRGTAGWALRLVAEVAARSVGADANESGADAAEVEARYGEAQALGEELGMLPLVAQCQRGLGEFLRRRGRLAEAACCFTAAAAMFRDMGAPAWAERTLVQARAGRVSGPAVRSETS